MTMQDYLVVAMQGMLCVRSLTTLISIMHMCAYSTMACCDAFPGASILTHMLPPHLSFATSFTPPLRHQPPLRLLLFSYLFSVHARTLACCDAFPGVPSSYSMPPSTSILGMPIAPPGKYGL